MFEFFSRHRGALAGWGLAAFALGLLLASRERGGLEGRPGSLAGTSAQTGLRSVTGGLGSFVDRYVLLVRAKVDADRLRREVADLRRELLSVGEVYQENQRLKTLLNFKEATDLPVLPARVAGRSASTWFRTLVLDKGSDDGVRENCPVVTAEGVVGRVYQVAPTASRVLLLTDTSSAVDALVQTTRSEVIVEGRLGARCRMLYLARADAAKPGDRVVTSGLGDVFPKGLLVGEIASVESAKGGVFRAAELRPSVDFASLEEVFVVLRQGDGSP